MPVPDPNAFFEISYFVDAAVRCGIDFNDVKGILRIDGETFIAFVARLAERREFRIVPTFFAVQEFREQARRRSLARSPRTIKDICLAELSALCGVL